MSDNHLIEAIAAYWNEHIHDLKIATNPVGSPEFFQELEAYRFEKLKYLPELVDFSAYSGQKLLEVGCGVGIDLVRFARGNAIVTGVDLSANAIRLAKLNFDQHGVIGNLQIMNGENLQFDDNTFDVVYAHGVLQYTADAQKMINELKRVLSPNGKAILMVYNRISWLSLMSKLTKVDLEHEDAPVMRTFTISEFKRMLAPFAGVQIVPQRFPVRTHLHKGVRATLYNRVFVDFFNFLPRTLVRPLGWHLMAFASKAN